MLCGQGLASNVAGIKFISKSMSEVQSGFVDPSY